MKRTPLARRTPLVARTPLNRGTVSLRRTELAPVSVKRRRENGKRTIVVNAMRAAEHGHCARCGQTGLPVHGHERLTRAHGGSIVAPDCLLCNDCNGWCEDNPRTAAWTGWKITPKWPHDPYLEMGEARALNGDLVIFAELAVTS